MDEITLGYGGGKSFVTSAFLGDEEGVSWMEKLREGDLISTGYSTGPCICFYPRV